MGWIEALGFLQALLRWPISPQLKHLADSVERKTVVNAVVGQGDVIREGYIGLDQYVSLSPEGHNVR